MTFGIVTVFSLIALALVLFAWERVTYDVVALIIASTLMVSGILTPQEGLSGLSNPATVTIASMFVLSEGLRRTGALDDVSNLFQTLGKKNKWLAVASMMGIVGFISGFINNTAAIAIFIPVVLVVAGDLGISPSKLLMPLSFASMFGGVCTLIGTSTNILISSIAEESGLEPLHMFELAPLGLIFMAIGFAYLAIIGIRMIPARRGLEEMTSNYTVREYLTDVVVNDNSRLINHAVEDADLSDLDLDVLQVYNANGEARTDQTLEAHSILRVRGSVKELQRLVNREDLTIQPARDWHDEDLEAVEQILVEAVIAPDSSLEKNRVTDIDFPQRFGAVVLAIRSHGKVANDALGEIRLRGGDSLLLRTRQDRIEQLHSDPDFVIVSKLKELTTRRNRLPIAIGILVAVVALAAFNVLPIVVSATAGCVLLVLTQSLTPREVYEAINWKIIMLLAGVIPLGTAMVKTGAADLISQLLTDQLGVYGPHAVLAGFFFASMMLTNVISNQATAALLAPIAITASSTLSISARPLLIAVTFAASLSFMTPVGYQTNTLVFGPGNYRFTDYTKVGTPLNLIFWAVATVAIPWFWHF